MPTRFCESVRGVGWGGGTAHLCSSGRACALYYADCRKDDGCIAMLHGSGESSQFVLEGLCSYLFSAGSPLCEFHLVASLFSLTCAYMLVCGVSPLSVCGPRAGRTEECVSLSSRALDGCARV